jgi:hypothetical protein
LRSKSAPAKLVTSQPYHLCLPLLKRRKARKKALSFAKFALIFFCVVSMLGCAKRYVVPDSSMPTSALTFIHGAGIRGSSVFLSFSDGECSGGVSQGALAILDLVRANVQTANVVAEKEFFIKSVWINGFGTHCSGFVPANTVASCLETCEVMNSFVPKAGVHYEVSIQADDQGCQFHVVNTDTQTIQSTVSYPVAKACGR